MSRMVVSAPCKINLTLEVFAPRPDGFHPLDSIVAPFTPADTVTVDIEEAQGLPPLRLFCDDPTLPTDDGNLAFRAARVFTETFLPAPPSITIRLTKRLPHQAGLGGGSSDAAAVLRALASRFPVSPDALKTVAAGIGSDVPLFLAGGAVRMRGRGEIVEPLPVPFPAIHGILVRPPVGVPTGPAYRLLDTLPPRKAGASTERLLALLHSGNITVASLGEALYNDFEAAVLPAYPEVADAHRAVQEAGAVRALLCGSGSAIFGLAHNSAHAAQLAAALRPRFPFVEVAASVNQGEQDAG